MSNKCIDVSIYSEKVYRLFLDVVKIELDKMGVSDINSIQAMMLYNISTNSVTVGELLLRGYYSGSNASYNIKRMIQSGYITQKPSAYDKRASYVHLSDKGLSLYEKLSAALDKYASDFENLFSSISKVEDGIDFVKNLGEFWKKTASRGL